MADDDVPPLVGVLPIPKPDPPAKKQAPLANFFGLPRPIPVALGRDAARGERERFAFSDF